MTDNISTDIRRIVRNSILRTFLLTVTLSTIGLFVFFGEESKSFEGSQGVTLLSIVNFILAVILSIVSLSALSISRENIYTDKFLVLVLYFVPIIFSFIISLLVVNSADKISFVPIFTTTPYLIFWTLFYRKLHRRIKNLDNKLHSS